MLHLASKSTRPWESAPPPGWRREQVCALSGDAPGPACEALVPEWFPPRAFARRARCGFHVRAGGRSTVVWPAEYAEWARAEGSGAPPAGAPRPCGALAESPRILSPVDGSTYFRDPRLAGTEAIRFQSESRHPEDTWWIDGARLPSTPGGPLWTLEPGVHRLELARGEARAVARFVVR
jgi:hypothetical protein